MSLCWKDTCVLPNVERTLSFMERITDIGFSSVIYKMTHIYTSTSILFIWQAQGKLHVTFHRLYSVSVSAVRLWS